MSPNDLPKQVLEAHPSCSSPSGIIPVWQDLLDTLKLLSLEQLHVLSNPRSKIFWKSSTKRLLSINQAISLRETCPAYLVSSCRTIPSPLWSATLNDRHSTVRTNFRIRMLTGCEGLFISISDADRMVYGTWQPRL